MTQEIKKGDKVLWIDEKGQGVTEIAEVTKILLDGKSVSAYEVKREGERPAAVFRAIDVIGIDEAPPGLIPLIKRLGGFSNQSIGPHQILKHSAPTGLEQLEELSDQAAAAGKPPLTLDVTLPADLLAQGPQKLIGTQFLDPDRQLIGLVGQVTEEGKARILIRPDREAHVRQLIDSGRMPEAKIC